jgi:hypothetical protein
LNVLSFHRAKQFIHQSCEMREIFSCFLCAPLLIS